MSFKPVSRFGGYAITVACLFAFALSPATSGAQDRGHHKASVRASARKATPPKASRKHDAKNASKADASTASATPVATQPSASAATSEGKAPSTAPSAGANKPVSSDAAEDVRKEGGSEVKVVEFTGLDIEGNLKTPQMLYFLNRLRAEFGRPRLPHRSFLPELDLSTKEKAF